METVHRVREKERKASQKDDRPLEEIQILLCEELLLKLDPADIYLGEK